MLKILQRYVLREVMVPAGMALGILTFLVLARTIFTESDQFAGAVLSLSASLKILGYILPTLLTLTVPMALLVGVLLGIGRLTVDSEIKACRTHGVNLFRTFLPVLALAAVVATLEVWNCLYFAPRMMARISSLAEEVATDLVNSLQPGMPYDQTLLGHSAVLYFEDKDPETGVMGKIYVSIETPTAGGLDAVMPGAKKAPKKTPPPSDALATSATLAVAGATSATRTVAPPGDADSVVKTFILATSGEIATDQSERRAALTLRDGTIHSLRSRSDPRYSVLEFGTMTLSMPPPGGDKTGDLGDWRKTYMARTSAEIGDHVEVLWQELPESARLSPRAEEARLRAEETSLKRRSNDRQKILDIWFLRAEQFSRISIAMACFAFVLIGVPLAVYIRPSGKAVGISIAFALFMVYYGFLYSGVHLVRKGLPIGPFLVFMPIGLLLLLGAVLLYRVVRR